MNYFKIKNIKIGKDYPPVVISEIGINHGGSLDVAISMADAAIKAGAKIIKHQTHIPHEEMSTEARFIKPGNSNKSIYSIIEHCSLLEKEEIKLQKYIEQNKCIFISSPFSFSAVRRLSKMNVPAYKIGSGECHNYPLIEFVAKQKKPVILSTGMNSMNNILKAVKILRKGKVPFALLHCTNIYPTPHELTRLNFITELKNKFPDAVIGLSDHTVDNYTCFGAVSLGARILEKHFTDKKNRIGPDIACSMDPSQLKDLIKGSNIIFKARGTKDSFLKEELPTIRFAFSSFVASKNIDKGEVFSMKNLTTKRPGNGDFLASDFKKLIKKKAKRFIKVGKQISLKDVN